MKQWRIHISAHACTMAGAGSAGTNWPWGARAFVNVATGYCVNAGDAASLIQAAVRSKWFA